MNMSQRDRGDGEETDGEFRAWGLNDESPWPQTLKMPWRDLIS